MKRDRVLSQLRKDRTLTGVKVLADYLEEAGDAGAGQARGVANLAAEIADAIEDIQTKNEGVWNPTFRNLHAGHADATLFATCSHSQMFVHIEEDSGGWPMTRNRCLDRRQIPTRWLVRMKIDRLYLERRSIELAEEALETLARSAT